MSSTPDQSQKILKTPLEQEAERLQLQHSVVKAAMGGQLLLAPLDLTKCGLRILDSACADGCWLRDLISTIPSSISDTHKYIGTDINPGYFPTAPSAAPIHFQKQSFNDPWPEDWAGSFDLVHERFALAGAAANPIPPIIHRFVSLLAPSGYIELAEIEFGGADVGSAMGLVFTLINDVLKAIKRDSGFAAEMKLFLEQEGLVDIDEKVVVIHVGGSREGLSESEKMFRSRAVMSMRKVTEGLVQGAKDMPPMSFSHAELETLPARVEAGLEKDGGLWRIHVVHGRKP